MVVHNMLRMKAVATTVCAPFLYPNISSSLASSPYPPGSNSLTSGLETLNLNNMKPDVMDEALKAFWSVAKRQAPKARGPADRAGRPELYPPGPMYPPRRNGPPYGPGASSPSHQWR